MFVNSLYCLSINKREDKISILLQRGYDNTKKNFFSVINNDKSYVKDEALVWQTWDPPQHSKIDLGNREASSDSGVSWLE